MNAHLTRLLIAVFNLVALRQGGSAKARPHRRGSPLMSWVARSKRGAQTSESLSISPDAGATSRPDFVIRLRRPKARPIAALKSP